MKYDLNGVIFETYDALGNYYAPACNLWLDVTQLKILHAKEIPESEIEDNPKINCAHCGKSLQLRNPSGYCDHLYYPDNCKVCREDKPKKIEMPEGRAIGWFVNWVGSAEIMATGKMEDWMRKVTEALNKLE